MQHKKTIHPMFAKFVTKRIDNFKEHALLLTFRRGQAQKEHYDELTRMVNMISMIALMQQDRDILSQTGKLKAFVTDIYNRYQAKKSFTLNAELLETMKDIVIQYDEFVKTQAPDVIKRAQKELILFENELYLQRLSA